MYLCPPLRETRKSPHTDYVLGYKRTITFRKKLENSCKILDGHKVHITKEIVILHSRPVSVVSLDNPEGKHSILCVFYLLSLIYLSVSGPV